MIETSIDPESGLLTVQRLPLATDSDAQADSAPEGTDTKSLTTFDSGADVFSALGSGASSRDLYRPYEVSAWVSRAISIIADQLSLARLTFQNATGDPVEETDLENFWRTPCGDDETVTEEIGFPEWLTAVGSWFKLEGESCIIYPDDWLASPDGGAPLAARFRSAPVIVAPSSLTPIFKGGNRSGTLIGWHYRDGSVSADLIPQQVRRIKRWNPYDKYRGLAEYKAAALAAETDHSAAIFAKSITDSNGEGSPIVSSKHPLTEPQQEQIAANLRARHRALKRRELIPTFIGGEVSVANPELQSVDEGFIAQRLGSRHEVFIAFGVPPSYADVVASYSVGSASDRFRLMEDAVLPLARKVACLITRISQDLLDRDDIYAVLDFDNHPVMTEVRAERFETAGNLWEKGIAWDDLSEQFSLGLPEFPGSAENFIPAGITPVQLSSGVPATPPETKALTTDTSTLATLLESRRKALTVQHSSGVPAPSPQDSLDSQDSRCPNTKSPDEIRTTVLDAIGLKDQPEDSPLAEDVENPVWKAVDDRRKPWRRKMQRAIQRTIFNTRAEVLANIEAHADRLPVPGEKSLADLLTFDFDAFLADLIEAYQRVGLEIFTSASIEVWERELDRSDPMRRPSTEITVALARRTNKLKDTAQAIFDDIKAELDQALDLGESSAKIAKRIRTRYNTISKERSQAIARTEVNSIASDARYSTFKLAGATGTTWLTSGKSNVRDSHAAIHGETRPLGIAYDVGGHPMLYPGDPNGPAHEVINCNCILIPTFD